MFQPDFSMGIQVLSRISEKKSLNSIWKRERGFKTGDFQPQVLYIVTEGETVMSVGQVAFLLVSFFYINAFGSTSEISGSLPLGPMGPMSV